jgi:hypothetical protein
LAVIDFSSNLRNGSQGQRAARGSTAAFSSLVVYGRITAANEQPRSTSSFLYIFISGRFTVVTETVKEVATNCWFTVELRQQPSSQGQQASRGRPGAEPQLAPLLSFTVALRQHMSSQGQQAASYIFSFPGDFR